MEKKNFFEKLFSIDEMKSSSLVLCLFASLGFGIFFIFEKGDLPVNLSGIIQALIYAIGGVSAVGWAANVYSNRSSSQYSNYGNTPYQPYQQSQYNPMVTNNTFTESPMTNPNNSGDNTDPSQRPI